MKHHHNKARLQWRKLHERLVERAFDCRCTWANVHLDAERLYALVAAVRLTDFLEPYVHRTLVADVYAISKDGVPWYIKVGTEQRAGAPNNEVQVVLYSCHPARYPLFVPRLDRIVHPDGREKRQRPPRARVLRAVSGPRINKIRGIGQVKIATNQSCGAREPAKARAISWASSPPRPVALRDR